jgi:hypothetical protein
VNFLNVIQQQEHIDGGDSVRLGCGRSKTMGNIQLKKLAVGALVWKCFWQALKMGSSKQYKVINLRQRK